MNRNLGNIGFFQQLVAKFVSNCLQLGVGKAIARECIDAAEYIAEFIVNLGSLCALRQLGRDRIHFAAQIIKDRPHVFVTFFEVRVNNRNAGSGLARDRVDLGHFLNFLFELVRNQQFNTFRTRTRKLRRYNCGPYNKTGVLRFWQTLKSKAARDD